MEPEEGSERESRKVDRLEILEAVCEESSVEKLCSIMRSQHL